MPGTRQRSGIRTRDDGSFLARQMLSNPAKDLEQRKTEESNKNLRTMAPQLRNYEFALETSVQGASICVIGPCCSRWNVRT